MARQKFGKQILEQANEDLANLRNPVLAVTPSTTGRPGRWLSLRPHLAVLAFYAGLTLLVAWPVVVGLAVGTPGHFPTDRNQNLWNFWWFKRSVLSLHNPYQTDFLFFPTGANLYLHTLSLYNQIVGLPMQMVFGLVPTYSLLELLSFPLGGYGGWLLGRYLTGDRLAALLVGLAWSFGPYHWAELRQDQINLVSLQWLPFFILFMFKTERATTRRQVIGYGLAAAFFYLLTLLVDYYYAIYLLMFGGLYWLWRVGTTLWHNRQRLGAALRPIGGLTGKLAAVFGLGMLPYSPLLYATIRETANPRYEPLDNLGNDQIHSTDLAQLFLPTSHQPWWGENLTFWQGWLHPQAGTTALNNWGAVIGYGLLGLSLYALWKGRGRGRGQGLGFWVFNGLFWLAISFGPSLRIDGPQPGWPMPYRLLTKLPFIGIGRFPERFILMAQLSLGVMGAFGLAYLLRRWSGGVRWGRLPARYGVAGLVLAVVWLESWPGFLPPPDPITAPTWATVLKAAASPQADPAILELPITKHSNYDSPRMLSQIYHERPITGGYLSRKIRDPFRTPPYPVLYDWVDLRTPPKQDVVPSLTGRDRLALLTYAGMGFVVLYPADFQGSDGRLQEAHRLLDLTFAETPGQPAKPFYRDDQTELYRVPPTPLDHPLLVVGYGWQEPEAAGPSRVQRWLTADASEGQITLAVSPAQATAHYNLETQVINPDPTKARRVQILINGQPYRDLTITGVTPVRLENLPLKSGDNLLSFRPDPADGFYTPPNDIRQFRLGLLGVTLTPASP